MAKAADLEIELKQLSARLASVESRLQELLDAGKPRCVCGKLADGRVRIFEGPIKTARDVWRCRECATSLHGDPV